MDDDPKPPPLVILPRPTEPPPDRWAPFVAAMEATLRGAPTLDVRQASAQTQIREHVLRAIRARAEDGPPTTAGPTDAAVDALYALWQAGPRLRGVAAKQLEVVVALALISRPVGPPRAGGAEGEG